MTKTNLNHARYELTQYINTLGQYDPERSVLMKALHYIDHVLEHDSVKVACTPKPGYINQKLDEVGGY